MITAVDNGILTTDLDAQHFQLLNVGNIIPTPGNLVTSTDPRLTDQRVPLDNSVTNAKVAAGAAIQQDKLLLTGDIPVSWLGTTATTAAQGNLAEFKTNKNNPNGYAGLDNNGHVPPEQLPPDIGTGTVTSIGLAMPSQFGITGSPVTTSGTITAAWNNVASFSWFGNPTGSPAAPTFNTTPLPVSLIPGLDANKIITGTIDPARLPPAIGVGVGHSSGAVPDPGLGGAASDYLGRDMLYHSIPTIGPAYQPVVPDPVLTPTTNPGDVIVSISESLSGTALFYKITPAIIYTEIGSSPSSGTLTLPAGQTLSVYGAKSGYNNSNIVTLVN
jgi:hypothetical protein